jgi:hypothetical protein
MSDNVKFKVKPEGWEKLTPEERVSRAAEVFAKAMRKEFDRSFGVTVDEGDGRIKVTLTEQDNGGPVMTVGDLSCLLDCSRAVVRQLCKNRAQRGPHPIPFHRISGKMIRFHRDEIVKWIATTPGVVRFKKPRKK